MKEEYTPVEIEVVNFTNQDVITYSGCEFELPVIPARS